MAASSKESVQIEAEQALALLEDDAEKKSGKFYVKVMKRILAKGEGYLATEPARLKRLLDSNISDGKKEEFKKRINVLSSFPAVGTGAKEEL